MSAPFRPSRVFLAATPPLVATMGRSEVEFTAALVVRACAVLGDRWQYVTPRQLGRVWAADVAAKARPFFDWASNPFLRVDFGALVGGGWARLRAPDKAIAFTTRGLEALSRWAPGLSTVEVAGRLASEVRAGTLRADDADGWEGAWELAGDLFALGVDWAPEDLEALTSGEMGVATHG